jgi:TolB-like protein/AraC-like DNA-binding protein/tetratricopeptide (TPR) repeat protein
MRSGLAQRITTTELAGVCGVSERTLHRHFLDFLGRSPLAQHRLMRLAAAREALLEPADGAAMSVTDVAARFGFGHLGRFASDYERRFGEPPSATLARSRAAATDAACAGAGGTPRAGAVGGEASRHPSIGRQAPTLAVLAFRAEGATLEERGLAESLPEQLAAALSRAHSFAVRLVRRPASGYGARDLDARYCLTGRVARSPDGRMRVVVRLLDLECGGLHLWGDAFDGPASDRFGLQDRVVAGAIRGVRPSVQEAEIERARRMPSCNVGARDLVLRALPLVLAADPGSARRALGPLEEAMDLGPDDPVPVALAAWCRAQLVLYQAAPDPVSERARALDLADVAAAMDPLGNPLALTARSGVKMMALQRDEAQALLARARAIDPGFAWALERSAWVKVNRGEPEPALGQFEHAMALKGARAPAANCLAGVGTAHYAAGRFAEAASWIRRALAENPGAAWLHRVLAPCYIALGERRAAEAALDQLRQAYPAITVERVMSGLPTFCGEQARRADGPIPDGLAALGLPH